MLLRLGSRHLLAATLSQISLGQSQRVWSCGILPRVQPLSLICDQSMARTKNPTSPAVAAAAKDVKASEPAAGKHSPRSKASSKREPGAASPAPKPAQEPEEEAQHMSKGATPEPGSAAKKSPATKKARAPKSKTGTPADQEGDGAGAAAAEATSAKRSRLGKGKKQEEEAAAPEGEEAAGSEGSKGSTPAKQAKGGAKKAGAGGQRRRGAKASEKGEGEGEDIEKEVAAASGDAEAAAAAPAKKGKRKGGGGAGGEGGEDGGAVKKKRQKKAPPVERVVYSEELRRPLPADHTGPVTKIMSWNVAGLRGVLKKNPAALSSLVERESPDVLCLQEIKLPQDKVGEITPQLNLPQGWHAYFNCCTTNGGYSGVAILSRHKPVSVTHGMGMDEHDAEGRVLVAEYPVLHVVSVYTPNSGEGLKRLDYRVGPGGWDESFAAMIKRLQESKPVVVIGDINVCPKEIDIHNPKTNLRSAGFTQEERNSFAQRLVGDTASGGCGLVDTLRAQHPEVQAYTYYSHRFNCRAKGIGWRLDNTLVSPSLAPSAHDSFILKDVIGSDHVPLGLTLLVDILKPAA